MDYKSAGLSDAEYTHITELLNREPNDLEIQLIGVMWSEHCSYKSTKRLLKTFPSEGRYVLQGQGENAGVVDVGEGWGYAFKVESHNHPSAVEPFQGAATGVGGIVRDIIAMGARPSASMDGLFLGDPSLKKTQNLEKGIVDGISAYGNAVGVPIVGGMTFYSPCYNDNPLVNAFSSGFVRLDKMASSKTAQKGDLAVLLGSKTGRDGIAGASFASRELEETPKESRPQVQIGDPFEENLLIECCMDLLEDGLIASMQDMGAAGILSSSGEIAHKSGCGVDIDVEKVPLREKNMAPWEIFLSETQERMLLVVEPDKLNRVMKAASKYELDCDVIGTMTESKKYRVFDKGVLIADLPTSILGDAPEIFWPSAKPSDIGARASLDSKNIVSSDPEHDLLTLLSSPNGRSKHDIWEKYDSMVQLHTIAGPGEPVAVVEVPGTRRACLLSMQAEPDKCWTDPYRGAAETMALSLRSLWLAGAEILGMTNCLNFASPEDPEKFYELEQSVRGIAEACGALGCPVVSGNVSLYNETASGRIYPTPLVVTAGILNDREARLSSGTAKEGDLIFLVGGPCGSLGASRYQTMKSGEPLGMTLSADPAQELAFKERALKTALEKCASSARALAGGGVAVALAREAIASGEGVFADLNFPSTMEEILFSEGGARAIYAVPVDNSEAFKEVWKGFPCSVIGEFGGRSFSLKGIFDIPFKKLEDAFLEGKF